MNPYLSQKLSILSLVSIFGVLVIHSFYTEATSSATASFIQELIGGQLVRFCIPLFFMISGYLFFRNLVGGDLKQVYAKLIKRTRTLLLPYILWNSLYFIAIISLQIFPLTKTYINTDFLKIIQERSVGEIFFYLFWEPAAFHLWFLKYLIIFMLSSPILFFLYRGRYSAFACVSVAYLISGVFCLLDAYAQNFFFFILGTFIAAQRIDITARLPFSIILASIVGYTVWCLVNVLYPGMDILQSSIPRLLLGCIAIWGCYDFIINHIAKAAHHHLLRLSSFTFFVYLFHEPWINVYKKIAIKVSGINTFSLIGAYITIPFIMYASCILVAIILKKLTPKTYTLLTGGRA